MHLGNSGFQIAELLVSIFRILDPPLRERPLSLFGVPVRALLPEDCPKALRARRQQQNPLSQAL